MPKLLQLAYQLSNGTHFSNIVKGTWYNGKEINKWHADIHICSTGSLVRFAGIWNTRKDAIEEATWIIERL